MLNYVWLGLLVLGIGTALTTDIFDQSNNKYMNGEPLPVEIWFEDSVAVEQNGADINIIIGQVAKNILQGGSIGKSIENNYGLSRAGGSY